MAPQDGVDALYQRLDTWCGNGLMFIDDDFEKGFQESDQADVLAEIIERSSKSSKGHFALLNAMGMVERFVRPDGTKPWNARLEAALFSQARNPDLDARGALVGLLIARHDGKLKDKILSFLKDDSDKVREAALSGITKDGWPDARQICLDYIARHQSNASYKASILCAKRYTNPADDKRAGEIVDASGQPNPQQLLEAYIASHKGDPDYEVSVDTAERFLNWILKDLAFKKEAEEERKREDMLHTLVADIEAGKPGKDRGLSDWIDFAYWTFDTKDSSTSQYACRYFFDAVPEKNRLEILTAMAERSSQPPVNNNVIKNILVAVEFQPQMPPKRRIWSAKLESLVWDQRNNQDRDVRSYVIRDLAGWGANERKIQILSFLGDNDQFVRETCVDAICLFWAAK